MCLKALLNCATPFSSARLAKASMANAVPAGTAIPTEPIVRFEITRQWSSKHPYGPLQ